LMRDEGARLDAPCRAVESDHAVDHLKIFERMT
jgi:hypothetical protein